MNDILVKVGADITDFSRKMADSQRSLQDFGKANQQTFDAFKQTGTMMVATGTGISIGLGKAVKTAAGFESQMSKVRAISGATGGDFDLLSEKAREMGASTSFSASDAAEGLEYMALAGWDTQQMLGGIEPILHLAEAGALDLGRASDLVTDSMSALGVEVGDLDGYLDKVAKTSASANTDIDALMEAFVVAGGTFKRFNVPLSEANTFLGVMANRGFKGSEAGTAINAIMTRLSASTGPAAEALKEIGVNAFDSSGQFRGMETVMKDVEKKLSGMTDQQRAHYQTQIAGLNHGKAFDAMLNGLGEEYDVLKEKIENSNGALKDMRDIMKDNLQGALENLSSAFEEIMISIGTALLPFIKQLVGWVQSLADWFNNLSDATKEKIAVALALVAVFSLVGGALLLLIGFLPQLISGFQAVGTVIKSVGLLFTGASLPVIGFTLLIAGLVLGIIHLWRTNEEFRNNMITIWENIQSLIVLVWEAIKPGALAFIMVLGVFITILVEVINWVVGVVASFTSWIVSFMETHAWIMQIIQVFGVAIGVIAGVIVIVLAVIKVFAILVTIVKTVGAVMLLFTLPVLKVVAVLGIIIAVGVGLWKLLQWLGEKFEWIGNLVDKVSGWMSKAWNKFLGFFGKGTKDASDEASEAISSTAEKGKEDLGDFAESGTASAESLNEGVKSNVSDMSDFSIDEISAMRAEGLTELDALNIGGTDAIGNMSGSVTDDIANMADLGLDDLSSLEIGGIDAMSGLDAGVTSNVSNMTGDVIKEVGNMESAASGDFSGLTQDMTGNAKKVSDEVSKSFNGMSKSIEAEMNRIKKVTADGMRNIGQVMSTSMKSSLSLIQTTMNEISSGFNKGFNAINRTIVSGFRQVNSVSKSESTKFVNTIKLANTNATKAYAQGFKANANAVRTGSNNAHTVVRNNNNRIVTSIRALNGQLRSAGAFAMAGLRSGLNAGAASVYSAARAIANRVANTMRAALQVRSPSRVMMEIGKWLSLGMAKGMDKYAGAVESSANSLAEAAIPSVDMSYSTPNGIASNLKSAVSGTVDVNSRDDLIASAVDSLRRDLANLRVVMDGREVGEIVSPVVSEYIDESASRISRGRGRRRI